MQKWKTIVTSLAAALGLLTGIIGIWQAHKGAVREEKDKTSRTIQEAKLVLSGPIVYTGETKPSQERITKLTTTLSSLDEIIKSDATNDQALILQGICYQELGEYQKALDAYTKALGLVQNMAGSEAIRRQAFLLNNIGDVYLDQCRLTEAELAFRETLRLKPEKEVAGLANANMADVLLRRRKAAEALIFAEEAVRQNDSAGEAHLVLGQAHWQLGRRNEALLELRRARSLTTGRWPDGAIELSRCLLETGDVQGAIAAAKFACATDTECPRAFQVLRNAYEKAGRSADAQEAQVRANDLEARRLRRTCP